MPVITADTEAIVQAAETLVGANALDDRDSGGLI
jgi:hypothetical protein